MQQDIQVDLVRGKACIVPYGKDGRDRAPERTKGD